MTVLLTCLGALAALMAAIYLVTLVAWIFRGVGLPGGFVLIRLICAVVCGAVAWALFRAAGVL